MLGNWIKMTTASTGAGALSLSPVSGYPGFNDVFGIGRIFYYTILNADGTPVESGLGNLTAANTLARLKCLATYSGGTFTDSNASFVSLAAGTYTVICALDESSAWLAAPSVNGALGVGNGGPPANKWLVSSDRSQNTGTSSQAYYIYYVPFRLDVAADVVSMAINVTTLAAGVTVNLGMYQVDQRGMPGAKIFETGALDCSTTGVKIGTLSAGKRLPPGWYYTAYAASAGGTVNFKSYGNNGFDVPMNNLVGVAADFSPRIVFSENRNGTTPTLLPVAPNPNDFQGQTGMPVIALGVR